MNGTAEGVDPCIATLPTALRLFPYGGTVSIYVSLRLDFSAMQRSKAMLEHKLAWVTCIFKEEALPRTMKKLQRGFVKLPSKD